MLGFFARLKWLVFLPASLLACGCQPPDGGLRLALPGATVTFLRVPAGACRPGSPGSKGYTGAAPISFAAFYLGREEVSLDVYAAYLANTGADPGQMDHPDLERIDGVWRPMPGREDFPATHLDYAEAERLCAWIGDNAGLTARLPTENEWEYAARGGIHGADYPWGWGSPKTRSVFSAKAAARTGLFPPNSFGLLDMAGNVYEWCREAGDRYQGTGGRGQGSGDRYFGFAPIRGGSWAETEAAALMVHRRSLSRMDYRGPDVGLRILVEIGE